MFALVWKKQTRLAAILSPLIGMTAGIVTWVKVAEAMYGSASIPNLGMTFPCMYASIASAFVPLPLSIAISYIWPDRNFEWKHLLQRISRIEDDTHGDVSKKASHFDQEAYFSPERSAYMKRTARIALYVGILTFLCQWVLWPLPMYGAYFVMSKGLFTAWVVVCLIWLFVALGIANFYPLIDGGFKLIWIILTNKKVDENPADGQSSPSASMSVMAKEDVENVQGEAKQEA